MALRLLKAKEDTEELRLRKENVLRTEEALEKVAAHREKLRGKDEEDKRKKALDSIHKMEWLKNNDDSTTNPRKQNPESRQVINLRPFRKQELEDYFSGTRKALMRQPKKKDRGSVVKTLEELGIPDRGGAGDRSQNGLPIRNAWATKPGTALFLNSTAATTITYGLKDYDEQAMLSKAIKESLEFAEEENRSSSPKVGVCFPPSPSWDEVKSSCPQPMTEREKFRNDSRPTSRGSERSGFYRKEEFSDYSRVPEKKYAIGPLGEDIEREMDNESTRNHKSFGGMVDTDDDKIDFYELGRAMAKAREKERAMKLASAEAERKEAQCGTKGSNKTGTKKASQKCTRVPDASTNLPEQSEDIQAKLPEEVVGKPSQLPEVAQDPPTESDKHDENNILHLILPDTRRRSISILEDVLIKPNEEGKEQICEDSPIVQRETFRTNTPSAPDNEVPDEISTLLPSSPDTSPTNYEEAQLTPSRQNESDVPVSSQAADEELFGPEHFIVMESNTQASTVPQDPGLLEYTTNLNFHTFNQNYQPYACNYGNYSTIGSLFQNFGFDPSYGVPPAVLLNPNYVANFDETMSTQNYSYNNAGLATGTISSNGSAVCDILHTNSNVAGGLVPNGNIYSQNFAPSYSQTEAIGGLKNNYPSPETAVTSNMTSSSQQQTLGLQLGNLDNSSDQRDISHLYALLNQCLLNQLGLNDQLKSLSSVIPGLPVVHQDDFSKPPPPLPGQMASTVLPTTGMSPQDLNLAQRFASIQTAPNFQNQPTGHRTPMENIIRAPCGRGRGLLHSLN